MDSADYNPYWLLYLGAIVLAGRYWKNAQDHGLETPNLALFQSPARLANGGHSNSRALRHISNHQFLGRESDYSR